MKKIQKLISLLLVVVLDMGIAACSNSAGAPAASTESAVATTKSTVGTEPVASAEKTVTIAISNPYDTLDPTNGGGGSNALKFGIGETLTKFEDGELKAWLADEWSQSDDGLTWTFQLHEGVTFHNGKAMDAQAVVDSLTNAVEKNSTAQDILGNAVMTADGNTLTITTEKVNNILPNEMMRREFVIIDAAAQENIETAPVCTGPFMCSDVVSKDHYNLVKNPNYWNTDVKVDFLNLVVIDDGTAAELALRKGEVDAIINLAQTNTVNLEGSSDFVIESVDNYRMNVAYLNFENPILADKAVRLAINHCIDRAGVVSAIMDGYGTEAISVFPATLPYGASNKELANLGFAYDVDQAKSILADAGYVDADGDGFVEDKNGQKFTLELVTYSSRAEMPATAQAVQANLKEIGINANMQIYDTGIMDVFKAGSFDIAFNSMTTQQTGDPQYIVNALFKSNGGNNFGHYANENVDALVEQLIASNNATERAALAVDIQKFVQEDAGFAFIAYSQYNVVTNTRISGLHADPMDYYQINADLDIAE